MANENNNSTNPTQETSNTEQDKNTVATEQGQQQQQPQQAHLDQELVQNIINTKIGKEREKSTKTQAEIEQKIKELQTQYSAKLDEYKTELEETKTKLTNYELRDKKLTVLRRAGLPEILVENLIGDTDEALEQSVANLKEATALMAQRSAAPIITSEKEPSSKNLSSEFTKMVREALG